MVVDCVKREKKKRLRIKKKWFFNEIMYRIDNQIWTLKNNNNSYSKVDNNFYIISHECFM